MCEKRERREYTHICYAYNHVNVRESGVECLCVFVCVCERVIESITISNAMSDLIRCSGHYPRLITILGDARLAWVLVNKKRIRTNTS